MFSSVAVIAFFTTILTSVFGLDELFEAIEQGNEPTVTSLLEPSFNKTLLGIGLHDVNSRDYELGSTPLEYAMIREKENIAEILIKKGASGRPLKEAINAGMENVVKLILEDAIVDVNEELIFSLYPEHEKLVTTFLHKAIRVGKASIVKMICDKGADLEKIDYSDFTPLQCAIFRNTPVEIVRILLEAGADVNATNSKLDTALHFNADNLKHILNSEIIDILLSVKGIKIEAVNIFGYTPLLLAARYANSECMRALLAAGANVHFRNDHQQTILHHSINEGDEEDIINLAKSRRFDFECRDHMGNTPFLFSARTQDVITMRALAKAGVNVNVYDNDNEGVMHYAVQAYKQPAEMVEIALLYGINWDLLNEIGQPLDLRFLDKKGKMGRLTRNTLLEAGLQFSKEKNMELLKDYWPSCHSIVKEGNFQNFQELFRKLIDFSIYFPLLKNDDTKMIEHDDEDLINLLSKYELEGSFALYKILKTICGRKEPETKLERRKFEIFDYAVTITMEGTYLTTLPVELMSDILHYNPFYSWKLEKMSFHFALAFDELHDVSLDQVRKAAIRLRSRSNKIV